MTNTTNDIISQGESVLMSTYARLPLVLEKGSGCEVTDITGKTYLDFVSGIAVNSLGHCDARLVNRLKLQSETLLHVSNLYHNRPQIELATRLVRNSFADKVFFCNSGAEAVESAIKLVRKFASEKMSGRRFEIISAERSFHGRTMAALSSTGQTKYQEGFDPLLPGFKYVPFNHLDALEKAITDQTAAILLEPIQGEGGVRIPNPAYFSAVRKICDQHGILLVLDEVQTGIGRTGNLFAYENTGMIPDIMTLAKGLGGGIPIGAMLATDRIASSFQPGSHASTFGGNPLACAAGVEVLDRLTESKALLENVRQQSSYLLSQLNQLKSQNPTIKQIRGRGLMIAIDLGMDSLDVIQAGMERGILFNRTSETTLRLIPPLTIKQVEIDRMLEVLSDILKERCDGKA